MKMDVRSITIAGAVLVMSSVAGFAQDWTKNPQDWSKSPQGQTQSPVTPAQTPQTSQPQIPQNRTPPAQNWTPSPPSQYQTEGPDDWAQHVYTHLDFGGSYQQNTTLYQSSPAPTTGSATFNLGMRGNLALGYNFNKSWAAEIDTGVIWNSMNSVDGVSLNQPSPNNANFDTYTIPFLVNLVYKVPLKSNFIPYVAVGAGGSASILSYSRDGYGYTASDLVFAYQAEVGLKYRLNQNMFFGVAYQFLGMTDPTWHSVLTVGAQPPTDYQFKESGFYTDAIAVSFTWSF
jgi:opacity protein-like surface antigen